MSEQGLSIVEPKRRKGKKQIERPKRLSQRKRLRMAIDAALEKKPKDFDELIKLLEADGYELKNGKHPAFRESGKRIFCGCGHWEKDTVKKSFWQLFPENPNQAEKRKDATPN